MDSLELNVRINPRNPWAEILVSQLAEYGFDSFVDTEEGIQAYGDADIVQMDSAKTETILNNESLEFELEFSEKRIPHQNWNALWESDFHPVFVGEKLSILAPFHDTSEAKGMTIIIQPQMSFGTGHHQTTWMMSHALLEMEEMPKKVLDMGTGTGVLAILAEKRGADSILAIDIEDWSVENTIENAERNGCKRIEAKCGNVDLIEGLHFELILANINKNILKAHLASYAIALNPGGLLFLSGFFESDADEMILFASQYGLKMRKVHTKETWAAIELEKTE